MQAAKGSVPPAAAAPPPSSSSPQAAAPGAAAADATAPRPAPAAPPPPPPEPLQHTLARGLVAAVLQRAGGGGEGSSAEPGAAEAGGQGQGAGAVGHAGAEGGPREEEVQAAQALTQAVLELGQEDMDRLLQVGAHMRAGARMRVCCVCMCVGVCQGEEMGNGCVREGVRLHASVRASL